jgi:hypothetical protein
MGYLWELSQARQTGHAVLGKYTQGEWEFTGRQDKVLGGVLAGTNYAMVPFCEPLAWFRGPSLKVDNL